MPTHVLESEQADEQRETRNRLAEPAPRKQYSAPVIASYELDPHDVGSADALTANG